MSDKKVASTADTARLAKVYASPRNGSFSIPGLSLGQWVVRLMPAIVFGLYSYSKRGAFQPPFCTGLGIGCPTEPIHLSGLLERPEYYGQVVQYYSQLMTENTDLGGTFAVFVEGQPVIDLNAGAKDLARTQIYDNRTLQQVYSCGKVIEGIVVARMVQRGQLKYESKITEYWPEFGQNGKEEVTLGDLVRYDSGVPDVEDIEGQEPLSWSLMQNEKAFSDKLARQRHVFDGEDRRAYHALSRGWYLNEIVKRADPLGRTIGQIAQKELMIDYKDVELYYGPLPNESDWEERLSPWHDYPLLRIMGRLIIPHRLQTSTPFGNPKTLPLHQIVLNSIFGTSLARSVLSPKFAPGPHYMRTKEAHAVESTSFSLKTNAHSLAKLMSMMANKGHSVEPGQEPDLLSDEIYNQATAFHSVKKDEITGDVAPLSVGGWVKTRSFYGDGPLKGVEVQGWSGAGGGLALWIEELQIGFAYVTNAYNAPETLLGDFRGNGLLERVVYARKTELGLLPANKA
ncbi:hypothetical protein EMPS_10780 [Entomortierella parvispora]|uniref:Beta-lactamase-related domain-containing protein n=1 Tax=Entomortierella parvispora TaxID=205924 RepID=A0A9P3HKQ1_9FUNG|nr:hypothetical protein EMPS_10780 [Entomortierella parvispora]